MHFGNIKTSRLILRPTTEADAVRAFEIQSDWDTVRKLRMASYPPNQENMDAWFREHANERIEGTAYRFAVELYGYVIGIADIDEIRGSAGEIGYWLDKRYWGKGYASECAEALVKFAFETLDISYIRTGHAVDNPTSGKVLQKLGFRKTEEEMLWYPARGEYAKHQFYSLERSN